MRIKKIATSVGVLGKILNTISTSTEDTYSCNYINDLIIVQNYNIDVGIMVAATEKTGIYTITPPANYEALSISDFEITGTASSRCLISKLKLVDNTIDYIIRKLDGNTGETINLNVGIILIKSS